jgi:outer membrane immunogenic protein
MRRLVLGLLAASSALAMASAASAADLRMPTKAPPPMPMFNWSGFYVGAHIGGTWGTTEAEINSITVPGLLALGGFSLPVTSQSFNGFIGGGQAGWNMQSGIVVFGIEGEIAGTNAKGTAPCLLLLTCESKQNWMATATGRLGLADGRDLYYVKGGAAWSHNTYSANLNVLAAAGAEVSDNRWGWLVGAGIEHAFAGTGLSAKLEYNYIDYGSNDYHFALGVLGAPLDIGTRIREYQHVVKVGVNYRFDSFGKGKAPVMAKY